ncbi:hypothetical protein [Enterovibrio norvegicus]|uniref:HEAT repeat-containing protein n=2 Tax=Enterovibrio norvegicus TaxID=188144 RepID=A0A1I5UTD2_9GAMM|nr:hypothetical protein [Enterovibrio norvegicus]SFP98462.1 hypothetical protein SAMN03084138_03732 [Enterovibrio norvegicus DSM 15893]
MKDSIVKRFIFVMCLLSSAVQAIPMSSCKISDFETESVHAITVSACEVSDSMASPKSVTSVMRAIQIFDANEFDKLTVYLKTLPLLTQEEALTVLVRRAGNFENMTPEREKFLVKLSHQQPQYLVKSQGDGYWVTIPAFNFAGEARWVLNHWKVKLLQDEVRRLLGYNELSLSTWLSFTSSDYPLRRDALVGMISQMTSINVEKLVTLYLADKNMVWAPDNAVLGALAYKTGDPALYNLLWRRRTDSDSLKQLQLLNMPPVTEDKISQMIAASVNPLLRNIATRQLAGLRPLPDDVKAFLLKQLSDRQRGKGIAEMIAKKGHAQWLEDLLESTTGVTHRNIEKGLDLVAG